eukprot:jgi/Orpsp1_1/1187838/evm.model.d7180000060508.2
MKIQTLPAMIPVQRIPPIRIKLLSSVWPFVFQVPLTALSPYGWPSLRVRIVSYLPLKREIYTMA